MSIDVILGTSFGILVVWWTSRARRRTAIEHHCGTVLNRADWYRLKAVLLCDELSTASLRELSTNCHAQSTIESDVCGLTFVG